MAVLLAALFFWGCDKASEDSAGADLIELKLIVDQKNLHWDKTGDYGGVVIQSYTPDLSGNLKAVRVAIDGRENTRELLIVLRKSDAQGFPMGRVLASGVVDIHPNKKVGVVWHEVTFKSPYHQSRGESLCLSFTPSVIKTGEFGYFEYAYSYKNRYTAGRLNSGRRGRKIREDDGKDLCFSTIVESRMVNGICE